MASDDAPRGDEPAPEEARKAFESYRRLTIMETGGSGSLGVTFPKDEVERQDKDAGDPVLFHSVDGANKWELYL